MKYLIAIDSDGTLRMTNGVITKRLIKNIKKIINQDNYIVITTARPRYHTIDIAYKSGASRYAISSNGAEVYDIDENKVLYATYLEKNIVDKCYDLVRSSNVRGVFVGNEYEYVIGEAINENQIVINTKEELNNIDIKQILFIDKNLEVINNLKKELENNYDLNYYLSAGQSHERKYFAITNKEASKGNAMMFLKEYLNCDKTIAIGNDLNDISMIKMADIGVAVDNACDELKEVANVNIKSNDENGVAIYLEDIMQRKRV